MNFSPFYCTLDVLGQPREFRVEIEYYEPYDPGVMSGPPDKCIPPEGGYFDPGKIEHRESGARDWEQMPWGAFLEIYASHHGTSLETAEDNIQELVSDYCEKCLEDRHGPKVEETAEDVEANYPEIFDPIAPPDEAASFWGSAFGYPGEDYYDNE